MINVRVEGEYDAEKNIVKVRFINKSLSFEDADYIADEVERLVKLGGGNKVWGINDISKSRLANPKIIAYYTKKVTPILDKYIIDYCIICEKPFERIAAQLFNSLAKEKHPIFKTMDEAMDWVLKEQETKGRFIPLKNSFYPETEKPAA